jgi:hypothetical protein
MASAADFVTIPGVGSVARRWARSRPIPRREGSASYVLTIVLTDDDPPAPMVAGFRIEADPPLTASELVEMRPIDLGKLAHAELFRKLADVVGYDLTATEHGGTWEMSPADVASVEARVRDGLGQQRKLGTRVDDAFLIDVVKRYQEAKSAGTPKPITAITEPYDVHERTARRWLYEAKDRGLT